MGEAVPSRIRCEIDFDRGGSAGGLSARAAVAQHVGLGRRPDPDRRAEERLGPTVLLTGGVHGDEYEGPIAVSRLAQALKPEQIQGRVIMMPAVNVPAVMNDTRLSPVDDRDLNRCFPGNPRGTFSQMLAHFMDSVVLPHADVSVDLHTAGHSGDSALSTNMHYLPERRDAEEDDGGCGGIRRAVQHRVLGRRRGRDLHLLRRAARHHFDRHRTRRLGPRQCRGRAHRRARRAQHAASISA